MKLYRLQSTLNVVLSTFLFTSSALATSQNVSSTNANNPHDGYYLIVAAYSKSKENFAINYTQKVKEMGFDAQYTFFPKKNYYMVYIKYFDDFKSSITELYITRKNTSFHDCWVYVLRDSGTKTSNTNTEASLIDVATNEAIDDKYSKEQQLESPKSSETLGIVDYNTLIEEKTSIDAVENQDAKVEDAMVDLSPTEKTKPKQDFKHVFFNLFRGNSSKEVSGKVEVIDGVKMKLNREYKGNEIVTIKDPRNGKGDLIFISKVFGYKKIQHDFNYDNPSLKDNPYIVKVGDTLVINFELARYTKGDIATMYNVFFYKDASIMKPTSKYELSQLVEMLKENPSMRIRIHGHTNGNAHGKIISLEDNSTNFFSLAPTNKKGIGSAKKLSKERAEMIRRYLEHKGIQHDHVEIKAWGGKAQIYDKHSSQAHKNVRVEIEVLQN